MRTRIHCISAAICSCGIHSNRRVAIGAIVAAVAVLVLAPPSRLFAQNVAMEASEAPGADPGAPPVAESGNVNFFSQDLGTLLRLRYNTESYGQDGQGNFDIGSMQVITMEDTAAILDGQVTMNDVDGVGFNVGVGYRWMNFPFYSASTGRVDGVAVWADGTHTAGGNFFPQIGASYESLGESWDLRGNMYIPVGRQDKVGNFKPTGQVGFEGNSIAELTKAIKDTSFTVGELEFARRLGAGRDAWAFAGPYFLTNDTENSAGYRVGVRGYAFPDLLVQLAVSDDDIFKTYATFQVQWFVGRTRNNFQPTCGVPDRMREPFMRNDYVALRKSTVTDGTALTNTDGTALRVVHVDSKAAAGGNGTFEHPYNALDQADGTGSKKGDIIFAHSTSTFTTGIVLQDNQRLLGEGNNQKFTVATKENGTVTIPESSPGARALARPMINGVTGDAITLADSNEVANFDIDGQSITARAIVAPASGAGNPNLNHLAISNTTGNAIDLKPNTITDPNDSARQIVHGNVTIDTVTLNGIGGRGINIDSSTTTDVTLPTVTLQEALALSNITSNNGTGVGINIENTHSGTGHTTTLSKYIYDGGTTSAGGIRLANFDGTFTASDSMLTNGATTGAGVDLEGDTDGNITFQSTVALTSLDGIAFKIDGNDGGTDKFNGSVTVASAITNDTGRSVSVENLASGATVAFNGKITDTGDGIFANSNSGGNVTFVGNLDMNIDTPGATAVLLTNNTGANIDFAGDVKIAATGDANGFIATGGGSITAPSTVNSISTATGQGVVITGMTIATGDVRFGDVNRTVAGAATSAIDLENNTGAGAIVIGNTTDTAGDAGTIQGGTADAVVIKDSTNVSVTGLVINNTSNVSGVRVEKTTTGAQTTNLSDLNITGGDIGIETNGGGAGIGALTMTVNDTNITSPTSKGMTFNNLDVGTVTATNVTLDGGNIAGTTGVLITDSAANITFDSTSKIRKFAANDFEATGAVGTVSFAGAIENDSTINAGDTSGNSVNIHGLSAGTVTFTSASTIKDANQGIVVTGNSGGTVNVNGTNTLNNQGISVTNNTGGTTNFSGTNTLSTGANDAVTITNNPGASTSIGNLTITTTSGQGFVATGGGSLTVSGFSNKITRSAGGTTGNALDIEGMTVGAVDFESVNATGGANGVRLVNNTTGTITVGDTGNAVGQGGTITGTADAGVHAANSNLVLNGVTVTNAGDAANENAVEITHTNATAMSAGLNHLTVTNATAARDGVVIDGTGGSGTFTANIQNMAVDVKGDGLIANSGVTLTAGGTNALKSDTGVGLGLTNVAISSSGANFDSVTVTNAATSGIVMQNVTGGQVAVGPASGAVGAGGKITSADDAIVLQNVQSAAIRQVEIVSAGNAAGDNGVEISHTAGGTTAMDITIDGLQVDTAFDKAINVAGANTNNFNLRLTDGNMNNNVAIALTGAGHFGLLVDNTTVNATGSNDVAFALSQSGSAKNADLTFRNNDTFSTDNAQALLIDSSGANTKTVNLLVENGTFSNNSAGSATADLTSQQATTMNATIRGNTFTNSNGGGKNYNMTSNGAAAFINLDLGGTGSDKNTAAGGLAEYNIHELGGSTFKLFDKTNTLNNTRNTGTVVTDPNDAAFDDLATPPTTPTVP